MKRILILTADYGYGHRSAANAIAGGLQETHGEECSVEIVNPMDDPRAPAVLRDGENGYDKIVRVAPDLYKLGFSTVQIRGKISHRINSG
jgi:1,2-diacylglycerol 3-beta-galactosyltransferase